MTKNDLQTTCPLARASQILGDFWTLLILYYLLSGPKRFKDLQENISAVSSATLTLRLKKLTEQGFIQRHFYEQIPPKVEYSLTEKGQKLEKLILLLQELGQDFLE